MTSRQARRERREAERKAKKLALKAAKTTSQNPNPLATTGFVSQNASAGPIRSRADINRANSQLSTGPRTREGKSNSSRNSLKHGLASGALLIPGEDCAEFDSLRSALLEEHRPANHTEELLVNEMAQSWWLLQRAIRFQNDCFTPEGVDEKRLSLFLRYQTTHERAFHKALNTLIRLRKQRPQSEIGFVSQNTARSIDPQCPLGAPNEQAHRRLVPVVRVNVSGPESAGFVSQNHPSARPNTVNPLKFEAA
jgi:hypothetical protein